MYTSANQMPLERSPKQHGVAEAPPSPKLTPQEKRRLFYPYYAGFSEAFVADMLRRLGVQAGTTLLDPWNGSGTTTTVGSSLGAKATGCDVNPVLTAVARARTSGASDFRLALKALLTSKAGGSGAATALAHASQLWIATDLRRLPPSARSLLMVSIFRVLREHFKHAATRNPVWFASKRVDDGEPVLWPEFYESVLKNFSSLEANRVDHPFKLAPNLKTGSFLDLPVKGHFDAFLTSPPYLTRLDYVKATLPELLLLEQMEGVDVKNLRRLMMGTPVVGGKPQPVDNLAWGSTAIDVLRRVRVHPSKASGTYYLTFYQRYFSNLSMSLEKLAKLTKAGGKGCIVVQSSHYKEVKIDLAAIVSEMARFYGLHTKDIFSFPAPHSMARVNNRASRLASDAVESAVMLERGEHQ